MSYKNLINKLLVDKKMIIGLGSGRCGTVSLSHLLNLQDATDATHERYGKAEFGLIWLDSLPTLLILCLIDLLARESKVVCDVGYQWLNYVTTTLSFNPNTKFICMQRDKEKTVDSFINRPILHNFIVQNNTREEYEDYYNTYYVIAKDYARRYDNFRIFDIENLNSLEGQKEMLDFLEFDNHKYDVGVDLK